MTVDILNIRDQWVQDFLWKHVVPADVRHGYTKLDAIRYIEQEVYAQNQFLIGNELVILRCVVVNKYVVEPHIMGNGHFFRSTLDAAVEYGRQHTEFKHAYIWTQHKAIGRIIERCGFTLAGTLPQRHIEGDQLLDMLIYVRKIQ